MSYYYIDKKRVSKILFYRKWAIVTKKLFADNMTLEQRIKAWQDLHIETLEINTGKHEYKIRIGETNENK